VSSAGSDPSGNSDRALRDVLQVVTVTTLINGGIVIQPGPGSNSKSTT
jgi:hypothetical protein